jgi:N-acetylmuramoyl-L-alanine amidase
LKRALVTTLFIIIALSLSPSLATNEDARITVLYDDGRSPEEISVWQLEHESEELYLRANDVARIFKATQFWNASSRKVVLGIEKTRFTLSVDTRVVVIDGEPFMLRNPVHYQSGFVMIPMEFIIDVASHYTPRMLEWSRPSLTLKIESIGYNVQSIGFASAANRSTATIKLKEPLLCVADTGTPGLVRLKIYKGRIETAQFAVREAHGLFNSVRAEQTDRDAYIYFDIDKIASRIRVERSDDPPEIDVILEKGELPEIPEPEYADKQPVEIMGEEQPVRRRTLRIEKIAIDPGHGGRDNGKTGVTGVLEKDVNLMLAKMLRDRIERDIGLEVILTREDDVLLSLTQRTEIANQAGADLFISLHCNSWFSELTGGFEAYFLSPARTKRESEVARVENQADELVDGSAAGGDIDFIVWDMVQNEFINESSHFAELIQKEMSERLEIRNRGVKQANFTVLQGAQMPAILIETGFLSNPVEERLLVDRAFQRKITEGIVSAIRQFRERHQNNVGGLGGHDGSGSFQR